MAAKILYVYKVKVIDSYLITFETDLTDAPSLDALAQSMIENKNNKNEPYKHNVVTTLLSTTDPSALP